MSSTVDPEARQHQAALQSTMQPFVKLMRTEEHHHSKYVDYIKDVKFLVDSHIPQLSGCEPKDVAKMIMTTIQYPECKYLCPTESTEASDSDEGMPDKVDIPSEGDILAEFPKEMLMTKVRMNIFNILEHMEMSHMETAEAMRSMKKNWSLRFLLVHSGYCCRPLYSLI